MFLLFRESKESYICSGICGLETEYVHAFKYVSLTYLTIKMSKKLHIVNVIPVPLLFPLFKGTTTGLCTRASKKKTFMSVVVVSSCLGFSCIGEECWIYLNMAIENSTSCKVDVKHLAKQRFAFTLVMMNT